MKKTAAFILCFVVVFTAFSINVRAIGTSASAHVLIDADTGVVLSANNENTKMKMASTTKIMTTLLALEEAEKKDRIVSFAEDMVAEGSSMYLAVGDKVKLSDLAKGMMMASGNDAANAVALTLCESFEDFAKLMNLRAQAIGMKNTNFVTPSGLDDENHYSTAFDMALLMAEAIKNESFKKLSSSSEQTVKFVYPKDKTTTYANHNRLLKLYEYCTGGKTGFTEAAGRCLVSSAQKDGVSLIAVTLDASDDWNDHKALYEYGFSLYTKITLNEEDTDFKVKLSGANEDFFIAEVFQEASLSVPAKRINDIKKTVYLPAFVFAPVKEGDVVGKITYTLDGRELTEIQIKASQTVDKKPQPNFFGWLLSIFKKD